MRTIIFTIATLILAGITNAQVYNGSLTLSTQSDVDNFNYTEIIGNLKIKDANTRNITNLDGLSELTSVTIDLRLLGNDALTNINGLSNLISVGRVLSIQENNSLTNLNGLSNLTSVENIYIYENDALTNIDGLSNLTSIGGDLQGDLLISRNYSLTNINGLSNIISIGGDLSGILNMNNNYSLTNIDGLSNLTSIGGDEYYELMITGNNSLSNLNGLSNLTSLEGDDGYLIIGINNTITSSFCGLYQLFNVGGVLGYISIGGTTVEEIIAGGPCNAEDYIPTLIEGVEQLVNEAVLNQDQGNALITKLNGALQKLAQGKTNAAINKLNAFSNQVNGFINAGILTPEQGQPLITAVNDIIDLINNGLAKQGNDGTSPEIPTQFTLEQNYPNPFNPSTTINYSIPELSFITIKVYDVLGKEIATLLNEEKPIGSYEIDFSGSELTSGVYFYQLKAGNFVETKKMILLR